VLVEKTKVRLKPLNRSAMNSYFKKINPMDKAGAYAIQTKRANIIAEVKGSLSNAIGLPIERLMGEEHFLGL
jgi:septum formation protein